MSRLEPATNASIVPVVRLAELPGLARTLSERVRAEGFAPDLVVYVETGARLFAHELAGALQRPLAPIWVRRGGHGTKRILAPVLARLPVGVRDWLRRVEERTGVHRHTARKILWPGDVDLGGKRVLVLDDAADTGRTIRLAQENVVAQGAAPEHVRTAVLAATTPAAQAVVDFYLFACNCRMPWSADSDERAAAASRAAALEPADAPRDF